MSEREKNVGWVSPKGVTQRCDASAHDDLVLRDEAPKLTCGAELRAQFEEHAKLEKAIKANLRGLGYGL